MRAICEDGVFRPTGPVGLPEGCVVEFDPKVVGSDAPESSRHTACACYFGAAASLRYTADGRSLRFAGERGALAP